MGHCRIVKIEICTNWGEDISSPPLSGSKSMADYSLEFIPSFSSDELNFKADCEVLIKDLRRKGTYDENNPSFE